MDSGSDLEMDCESDLASAEIPDSLARCMDWILDQADEPEVPTINQELSENTDEVAMDNTASLSLVKGKNAAQTDVYYTCEWKQCLKDFEKDDHLCEHVVKHIAELKPMNGKYCCQWDLCYFETICNEEITRHIYYHAYHTVIKTIGESLCKTGNIPRCTNDSRNRNSVPELKHDFKCEWDSCKNCFKSIYSFHKHVKSHCSFDYDLRVAESRNKKPTFTCKWEGCESQFGVFYRLSEHIRKHTNEKIVACYHCGGIFSSNTILFNHCKRQLANNTQEYQCAECFKYFASERILRHHVFVHVNCLKCTMCNMTCNTLYTLSKHIRYRHLKERPFMCVHCNRGFVCKTDLNKHTERIHQKKVYECAEAGCNFSCKSIFILKRHDAEAHGNTPAIYACHCCEKMYKTSKSLSKHLIKIHGFQLPPGHSRFWYRIDENGLYRLQTMRIESLEVTRQILSPATKPIAEIEMSKEKELEQSDLSKTPYDLSVKNDSISDNILVSIKDVSKSKNK